MATQFSLSPRSILSLSVLYSLGCAAPSTEAPSARRSALQGDNGKSMNGIALNGKSMNGKSMNGGTLAGLTLAGVELTSLRLEGTHLVGVTSGGATLRGTDFIGAEMIAETSDGDPVAVRLHDIHASDDPDLLLYQIQYATGTGWEWLCGVGGDGLPEAAFPVAGRWDPLSGAKVATDGSFVTLACSHAGAVGKCVTAGYKPWRQVPGCSGAVCPTLERHHQACTRMLRADYCGDGTSHTREGWSVVLFDSLGIQNDDHTAYPLQSWLFDAQWDDNGARCFDVNRWPTEPLGTPSCGERHSPACGSNPTAGFAGGPLILHWAAW